MGWIDEGVCGGVKNDVIFEVPPVAECSAVAQRIRMFRKMLADFSASGVVVSFHTGIRQNLWTALTAKLWGRKVIREINEWPLSVTWGESWIKQWIEIHILPKLFDGAICISDVLVDFWKKHGRKGVPILKLPILVDVEEVENVSGFRFQVSSEKPYVCYAGSMTEAKDGVETLKRAFERVKGEVSGCKFQVSGSRFQGEDLELMMISGKSHEEAIRIMKGAVCLVLARPDSLQARAGFPTKLGEYLATGRPVVVTDTGETGRYLKDGENAYIVRIDECSNVRMEKAVAEKILEVLRDPVRAERIGAAGMEVAKRCFDWHVHAEELREWLKQFI